MRTTINLADPLLSEAKNLAAERGSTFTAVVEDALREMLTRHRQPKARARVRLTTFDGKGLQPGVDLDDSAALADLMEGSRGLV